MLKILMPEILVLEIFVPKIFFLPKVHVPEMFVLLEIRLPGVFILEMLESRMLEVKML